MVMKKLSNFRRLLRAAVFVFILFAGEFAARYAMSNDSMAISRFMMHDMYSAEENIDVLFLGASHVQLAFDTALCDELLGANSFNAGSSMQTLGTSLALLREIGARNTLREVYVDLDCSMLLRDDVSLESIYAISDYMKPSWRRLAYLLEVTPEGNYMNTLMPFGKGRGYYRRPADILRNLRRKLSREYLCYEKPDSSYGGKGYIAGATKLYGSCFCSGRRVDALPSEIPEKNRQYLREIIEYCGAHGIRLHFIAVPVSDYQLVAAGNYDVCVQAAEQFLAQYGLPFYDFNLAKPAFLDLSSIEYYTDSEHLNRDGAAVFDRAFAKLVTGGAAPEELFYASYADKLAAREPAFYGFVVQPEAEGLAVCPVSTLGEETDRRIVYALEPLTLNGTDGTDEAGATAAAAEPDGAESIVITATLDGKEIGRSLLSDTETGGQRRIVRKEAARP